MPSRKRTREQMSRSVTPPPRKEAENPPKVVKCQGCVEDQPNQQAHFGFPGGCLNFEDE